MARRSRRHCDTFQVERLQQHVRRNALDLDIERVATGEYWYGTRALELGLVDELGSSDDYLMHSVTQDNAQLFSVEYKGRETLLQRLQAAFASVLASLGIGAGPTG